MNDNGPIDMGIQRDELMELAHKLLSKDELEAMLNAVLEAGRTWVDVYLDQSGKKHISLEDLELSALFFVDMQQTAIEYMWEQYNKRDMEKANE